MYGQSSLTPYFVNVIKPKNSISSTFLSTNSIKNIDSVITGIQKLISIYDKAVPIYQQTKPMIDNIKTTFKVARAFRKFSNDNSLESAFDNLPDYEQTIKEETKKEHKVSNPFYP